ncbi:hypothetical protein AAFF_G00345650 [Aldrovandia affinis]|uniref:Uncharacterized protein n=1 Tax=Aldrovandia affinis TaxID=143900 RepID=A0AAD7SJB8_9TELE|nr:hypothetical protein AAFF_G00345650 [Aldrovandia affinis]
MLPQPSVCSANIALGVTYGAVLNPAAVCRGCVLRIPRSGPVSQGGESRLVVCPLDRRGGRRLPACKTELRSQMQPEREREREGGREREEGERQETCSAPGHARNEKTKLRQKNAREGGRRVPSRKRTALPSTLAPG